MPGAHRLSRPLVSKLFMVGVLASVVVTLNGCKSRFGEKLSFETVERQESPGTGKPYPEEDIHFVVFSSATEVGELDEWVSEAAKQSLIQLDYSEYFALVVFRGNKPTTGYHVEVTSVRRLENTVTVEITLQDPLPGISVGDTVTSPYHIIKIEKGGDWNEEIIFNMLHDNTRVLSSTHFIP